MKIFTVVAVDADSTQPYGIKSFKNKDVAQGYAKVLADRAKIDYLNDNDVTSSQIKVDVTADLIDINVDGDGSVAFVFTIENELN